ncbi:MAG: exodeoxyribonuclease III [Planctomycetes bacterium]|nr:exodeoxyribonuclease III [Planctomycetota bacterium]MCB9869304.1 exodeoxyribonuclease III [Planctomycetota bacterium]
MHVISWNVNGLRALHGKGGFLPVLRELAPDVLLLQETKTHLGALPGDLQDVPGYHLRMHSAQRNGYSGVAIYCREEPDEWCVGLGDDAFDSEGRVLGARFGDRWVVSAYFPNSQAEGARLAYRLAFGEALLAWLQDRQGGGHHVVLGGDFNVAHRPIDLARPKANEKNPGYLPAEREWMTEFLASGYVDTWRRMHPELAEVYSWWSYRYAARDKNIGWRLDYLCVDEPLWPRVEETAIHTEVRGSDHCPVGIRFASGPHAKPTRASATQRQVQSKTGSGRPSASRRAGGAPQQRGGSRSPEDSGMATVATRGGR